jgi:hypothetical protein
MVVPAFVTGKEHVCCGEVKGPSHTIETKIRSMLQVLALSYVQAGASSLHALPVLQPR